MALKIGKGASAPPFLVMDVIAAANARQAVLPAGAPQVIRMEVGQPGTGAPVGAVAAVQAALQSGHPLGYTEAFGLRSLRQRIAVHAREWYGLDLPIERIAVTVGASGAFPLVFLAAFDAGDRIAMTAPFYPPYVNILTALGMIPVILEAGPETRFQPSVAMLSALDPPPDGLIVASPCNPAGTMLHRDELAAIAIWCDRNGVRLISDEIYHGLNYDNPIASAAEFSDTAVVVNSFSKYFSMTGWRVGWLVLPPEMVHPGRAPGAKPVHQRALYFADSSRGGVRLSCRVGGQRRAISAVSRSSSGRIASRGVQPTVRRRGSVLPVR